MWNCFINWYIRCYYFGELNLVFNEPPRSKYSILKIFNCFSFEFWGKSNYNILENRSNNHSATPKPNIIKKETADLLLYLFYAFLVD